MLTYNTKKKRLILPEYGRNIQQMIDYCTTITDRDQRNSCAQSIIKTMSKLFPENKENVAGQSNPNAKFWDHLAIMSGFSLDIDWPEGTIAAEALTMKPNPVPMTQGPMRFHIYGKNIQRMMEYAMDLPGGEEKDEIIMLLANQMKKQLSAVNPDGVDDARIFKDIADMTNGEIRMTPEQHHLYDFKVIQPANKKKRKK
ncbi:MAG: DUF4290 domain-containing protein [Muribaculaceae bacterium]|nr:DUF4290 domain-containing protein [Muribaculaceae bacterium]